MCTSNSTSLLLLLLQLLLLQLLLLLLLHHLTCIPQTDMISNQSHIKHHKL
jgi:hypothetical protein